MYYRRFGGKNAIQKCRAVQYIQVLTVIMMKDPGGKLSEFDQPTRHSGGLAREQSTDTAGGRCQQAFSK